MLIKINVRFTIIMIAFLMSFLVYLDLWIKVNDLNLLVYEIRSTLQKAQQKDSQLALDIVVK
jgi:hypothetical protein